jgi:hypothetical protein
MFARVFTLNEKMLVRKAKYLAIVAGTACGAVFVDLKLSHG